MTPSTTVVEVIAAYRGTVIDVRHLSSPATRGPTSLTIGQGHDVWLPAPIGYPSLPLVSHDGDGWLLCLCPEMSGSVDREGHRTAITGSLARLEPGTHTRIECGELSFEIRLVPASRVRLSARPPDWPLIACIGAVAMVVVTTIALLVGRAPEVDLGAGAGAKQARFVRYMNEPAAEPKPTRSLRASPEAAEPASEPASERAAEPPRTRRPSNRAPSLAPDSTSNAPRHRGLRGPAGWKAQTAEPAYEDSVLGRHYDPMDDIVDSGVVGALGDDDPVGEILAGGSYNPNATTIDEAFRAWADSDLGSRGVLGELTLAGDTVGGGTADRVEDVAPQLLTPGASKVAVTKVQISGELDPTQVRGALRRGAKAATRCFDALDRPPSSATITIEVSPSGDRTVMTNRKAARAGVDGCLETAVAKWDLPKSRGPSRIRYRLDLDG